jgi:hypothetical protein
MDVIDENELNERIVNAVKELVLLPVQASRAFD